MNVDVTFNGLDELLDKFDALPEQLLKATGGALYRQAEIIMADSKENYVPVDDGTLRDSGYVEPPVYDGEGVSVALGYGGAAAAYATVQHEDFSLNHPNGGGPKYLERPLLEHGQTLARDVAEDVRAELGL